MLVALRDDGRIEAARAEKGPLYRCPNCRKDVILKKGRIRVHHFSHKPPVSCFWPKGETFAHLTAKSRFRDAFERRGLKVAVEHEVESLLGDRRADVMVCSPNGRRVAIELQHNTISVEDIETRTEGYLAAGISVIWVPFLPKGLLETAESLAEKEGAPLVIKKYPARAWERWLHGYNFGGLWMYDPSTGKLWRGRLKGHELFVEPAHWFDETGEERYTGGNYRYSKRWRELTLWGPIDLDGAKIEFFNRRKTEMGNFRYPGGKAARFTVR
ncbi:MAG: competence protein CoiA family protein [Rhodospirillales bacterium]|jgi:competence protein CoiA|nr:competence protein CoiA family protein [Rhodospirillales bacterium]MDP7215150.1 competence protein CoiA family protein [Rhodospirillales bacterium]HIJ42510.1 hypothetical protein [Rhodospirillaceae bacterium]HIJ92735.1 hypothetical protein [Rhodospirillaceae bacterium]HJP53615.1 competence protein CoiA family protein [Rhodospirillales bacterium]